VNRRKFILSSGALLSTSISGILSAATTQGQTNLPRTEKMPVLFVGHGSPMNAIRDNSFSRTWRDIGERLPTPNAILVISAHWLSSGNTQVMATPVPKTIYDFGGFPQELFDQKYPAPGSLAAANLTYELLQEQTHSGFNIKPELEHERGLDHGTWSVLNVMYPKADIPVFQLSIDYDQPAAYHYDIGRQLAELRSRGVMIMGSGNIIHNLFAPRLEN